MSRRVPEMRQGQRTGSCDQARQLGQADGPACDGIFPIFPNDGTGYKVPEEVTFYRYDLSGNLLYAENADAVVRRSYFPNGQVRTDSSFIRDFTGSVAFSQVFGMEYGYHEGRLTRLVHPGNLAGSQFIDKFSYHPVTGALSMAEDRLGNFFSFTHDNTGALTGMTMPGGITDRMSYDQEGRLERRRETSPAYTAPLQDETYTHDARNKLVSVSTLASVGRGSGATFWQWYSGLGNLVMTHWGNDNDAQWQREGFVTDGLGNVIERRTFVTTSETPGVPNYFRYSLDPSLGRVDNITLMNVTTDTAYDKTTNFYDGSGNLEASYQAVSTHRVWRQLVDVRSYYGMDDRLRAFQKYDDVPGNPSRTSGLFEEYRYDPLGRRVGVLTRRPNAMCNQPAKCYTSTTFFVWAGDNLLWEIKDTDAGAPPASRGRVSYFQAGGIDRPLVIWKSGVGSIVTHQNWRGQFSRGTWGAGSTRLGQSSDCAAWPSPVECVPVPWPGWNTKAWHEDAAKPQTVGTDTYWLGSLSVGMRDASGQMYMRNRYYNPATGQFTQPDPIGLAGGLNSYGFAAGDPVSYSDPYGLCPLCIAAGAIWAVLEAASSLYDTYDAAKTTVAFAQGDASGGDLALSWGGLAVGAVAPLGGYGAAARELVGGTVNPRSIRFTQNSISDTFKDGGSVRGLADDLRSGAVDPSTLPPIRLVERNGTLFTLDNRRAAAGHLAGVNIPARMATSREIKKEFGKKFTTSNGGTSIEIRNGGGTVP